MEQPDKKDNLEIVPVSALEALQRAEVDIAVATAKKYPRDIALCLKTCRQLALRNAAVAATCNYAVPRAGKKLVGPSVHFARIVAYSWGNGTALSRVVGADRANVHLQGVFHDLETNLRIGVEMDWPVQPPKTDSPERWVDQINLAKRAGASVALRTAIFNVIPQVIFADIAEEAKRVAVGEGKTFIESRNNAVIECKALGISQEMLYRALEVGGLESISTDDLIWLHAALTSVREGTSSVAEIFGERLDPVRARVPAPAAAPKEEEPKKSPERVAMPSAPPLSEQKEASGLEPSGEPEPVTPPPPVREKKRERKAPSAQSLEPEEPVEGTAGTIRARLTASGLSEEDLLAWLDDLGTIADGTTALETVNPRWLRMVKDDWPGISLKVKAFAAKRAAGRSQESQ